MNLFQVPLAVPPLLKLIVPVDGRSVAPFAVQPTKLLLLEPVPVVQEPEAPSRYQPAPSLPRSSTSESIDVESSMAMMRLGSTPVVRNNGVSEISRSAADAEFAVSSDRVAAAARMERRCLS